VYWIRTDWYGFAVVADAAARLNRIVTAALLAANIPAWTIQPSVPLRCYRRRRNSRSRIHRICSAVERGLVPVVHGDVALDSIRGGTIASTEEIFDWLTYSVPVHDLSYWVKWMESTRPTRRRTQTPPRIRHITPKTVDSLQARLGHSHGVDVTGGMAAKVAQSIGMVKRHPGMEIVVCSGSIPGNVLRILTEPNAEIGTRISA
jgi:isopentenyl phosphate kinase